MEGPDQVDNDQLLYESGLSQQDCADMPSDEKAQMANAIKASREEAHFSSTCSSNQILSSPTRDDGLTRPSPRTMNNVALEISGRLGLKKTGTKPQSGLGTPVKDNSNRKTMSPSVTKPRTSEQSMDGTKKSNENGGLAKKAPISKQQEKLQNCDEETVKSPGSTSDSRGSDTPDSIEDELVPSLMQIVFEKHKSTSRFPEKLYPAFSLCQTDWVKQAGQYLFERKVAKIKSDARRSKWVTIYEKTINITTLERIAARSPTAKEPSPGPMESRSASQDHNDKAKVSPQPEHPNNIRENSPPNTMQENSSEASFSKGASLSNIADLEKLEVTSTSGTSKTGYPEKLETLPENNSERNEDETNNKMDNQGKRNRRKRNGNQKNFTKSRAPGSSVSSPIHDEASKSELDLPTSAPKELYSHYSEDYPPLNGISERMNTDNRTPPLSDGGTGNCPMCQELYPMSQLQDHAWHCNRNCNSIRSTEEETKQVAAKEENGSDSDVMEVETSLEENKLFPREGLNQNNGCSRSSARIRSMKRSGGEWLSKGERPSKNLRK